MFPKIETCAYKNSIEIQACILPYISLYRFWLAILDCAKVAEVNIGVEAWVSCPFYVSNHLVQVIQQNKVP